MKLVRLVSQLVNFKKIVPELRFHTSLTGYKDSVAHPNWTLIPFTFRHIFLIIYI